MKQQAGSLGGQPPESARNGRDLPWLEGFLNDVRFGLRLLRKSPGFTVIAILTLALGIGATAAIFTVVDRVLLEPMAYPHPDRIVVMLQHSPQGSGNVISIPKYLMWRNQTKILEDAAAYDLGGSRVNLIGGDQPEQLRGMHVSSNFFSLFGIQLAAGRTFTAEEDTPGGPPLAVISNGLWKNRFGSDPRMIGKTIDLDNTAYTVIGILAPFYSPDMPPADVFLPLRPDPDSANQGNYLRAAARLKPGVTLAMANAELKIATAAFRRKYPNSIGANGTFAAETIREMQVAGVRASLLILLGAVGFVLLIACANLANLLLARSTLRKRELSIRAALGAGRGRIVRQILTESLLLSLAGGAVGLFLGYFGVRSLLAINPGQIPRIGQHGEAISLDWRVLLFALGISALAGVISGIIPAIKASQIDLAATIKEGGARAGSGLRHNLTRSLLVVTEVALAMILLVGSALLIRTFRDLRDVNPGFQTYNILTMDMSLTGKNFAKTAAVAQLEREGRERLTSLPGVEAAALSCCLPLEGGYGLPFNIEGRPPTNGPYNGGGGWRSVSPGYFRAFGIPLLRGRTFTDLDNGSAPPVVIINQAMAKQFWPKGNELGARITIGKGVGPQFTEPPREIVGVVGNTRDGGLHFNPGPTMYVPIAQVTDGMTALSNSILPMSWIVRTRVAPFSLNADIQRQLRIASGGLPVGNVRSMQQVVAQSTAQDNFNMTLLTIFAGVALLLAAIGVYGLMAYSVQQRTQEIGIRMTLGASPQQVRGMIGRQGMTLALVGVVIGVAGSLALTRLLRSMLFGVKPWDPVMLVAAAVALSVVALLACLAPAQRATRVDAVLALRQE
jgi:putative ABC transport system permease protein